ncbi:MAG: PP2C family protein-serine/threonine phosphatase [Candidatus Tectimicrobiota bacterium]
MKILVVDDEPDLEALVRQKFRRHIRSKEFEFIFARHGAEALDYLRADRDIELVLTDINMPVMDGLTLLTHLGDLNPILQAVIISAYGDMQNIRTAMNLGAFDFLTKPINLDDLTLTIDKTVRQLHLQKQALHEHDQLLAIKHELQIATHIQQATLPRRFPPFPERHEFDLYAEMIPAREVGGDFYDFFLLDETRLGLVIGDVSGKGVPAALLMATSRMLVKSIALSQAHAAACLQQVNRLLAADNDSMLFISLVYGILHLQSGALEYCNAGHHAPYVLGADGTLTALPTTRGLVLGLDEQFVYTANTISVAPGSTLLLYTDGIPEAFNRQGAIFSVERLEAHLRQAAGQAPQELLQGIVQAVREFAAGAPQSDDLTLLAVTYGGASAR